MTALRSPDADIRRPTHRSLKMEKGVLFMLCGSMNTGVVQAVAAGRGFEVPAAVPPVKLVFPNPFAVDPAGQSGWVFHFQSFQSL